jgi:SAM-dependent methyltransferase
MTGDAKRIALPDASVDKIVHMNVCYFFDPLDATLQELLRVLKPGGMTFACFACNPCVDPLPLCLFKSCSLWDPLVIISRTSVGTPCCPPLIYGGMVLLSVASLFIYGGMVLLSVASLSMCDLAMR